MKSLVTGHTIEIIEEVDTLPSIPIPQLDTYEDDEPTVKIQVPTFRNQVVVSEKRYPGIGLIMALSVGLTFWGLLGWFIFR